MSKDLIDRKAAIDLAKDLIIPSESFHQYNQGVSNYCAELVKLQPAQPPYNLNEWCHDCKEYDQERHCCPRYNKMIRRTLEDMKRNSPKLIYCSECVRKCRFYDTQGDGGYCRYGKDKDGNINPQREVKTE